MIKLTDVTKSYKTRQGVFNILNNVYLEVAPGEKVGILGRNGAGKSTLIRLISGAERPSSGSVQRNMMVHSKER